MPLPAATRQTSPRFMRFEHPGAAAHVSYFGWAIGPTGTAEHHAATLIAHALGSGETSTLRSVFVKQRGMLRDFEVRVDRNAFGNLFSIRLELKSNVTLAQVEKLLALVLARIRLSGLTAAELARARAALDERRQAALADTAFRAAELASPDYADDPPLPNAAELKRAAGLLAPERQSLVELVPPRYVPAQATPAAAKAHVYVVKQGDTLSSIARRLRVSVEHLTRKNRIARGARLRIGQRLSFDSAALALSCRSSSRDQSGTPRVR